MADRYPLVVDATNNNKIKEIPSGDNLLLTGNSITGVVNVTASGTVTAQHAIISGTLSIAGNPLASIASTGAYSDLTGAPSGVSSFTNDSNYVSAGANLSSFTNDLGFVAGSLSFGSITGKPNTLAGYGIIDAATQAQGGLATSALQPGANTSTLNNDSGFVTLTQLTSGAVTVDVNNSGDLVGSVFADDSTVMIDSILAAINLDGTIRGNVKPNSNQDDTWDIGSASQQFKDLYLGGTIKFAADAVGVDLPANSTVNGIVIGSGAGGGGGGYITIAADDSTQRVVNIGETFSILGGTGITTASDAEGVITITRSAITFGDLAGKPTTVAGYGITDAIPAFSAITSKPTTVAGYGISDALATSSLGAITFTASTIDTSDSSTITITPAVTMQSDLIVENSLTINNDLVVDGTFSTTGSGTPEVFSDNEIELNAGTRIVPTTGPIQMLRVTTTQRNALTSANGDIIYNTTDNKFQGYENGAWANLI